MPYTSGVGCESDSNSTGCAPCRTRCSDPSYAVDPAYLSDNTLAGAISAHSGLSLTDAMKLEIMTNGPILTSYEVYEDFFKFFRKYPRGVYVDSEERIFSGRHAVKVVGWGNSMELVNGVQSRVEWWIVANSWGSDWGDSGFFRYRLGIDLGGFEKGGGAFTGCVAGSRCVPTFPTYKQARGEATLVGQKAKPALDNTHVGGWNTVDSSHLSHDVTKVAVRHMATRLNLAADAEIEIVSVDKQIVAGVNYRLVYSIGGHHHEVKLFRDLDDQVSVVSMEKL